MRYETQADLLRLIDMLGRHYTAVSLSLRASRSFDSTRMLVFGCMACLADAIIRVVASDRPSKFSLHYDGKAEAPAGLLQPFGLTTGYFAIESEDASYTNPDMVLARTQMLDYFEQQKTFLTPTHSVFCFEKSMELSDADHLLVEQVCMGTGFLRDSQCRSYGVHLEGPHHPEEVSRQQKLDAANTVPKFMANEDHAFMDQYPELLFFRNIVFYFKAFMTPKSSSLPAIQRWRPMDSELHWAVKEGRELQVHSFGQELKCCAYENPEAEQKKGLFSRFASMLSGEEAPRAPPSASDPSNLADERIDNEDDALHIRHLPSFDGRLSAQNSELLLQYLTAPYLRVPLVLEFFASEMRLASLSSADVQACLDSCLFEPGLWQGVAEKAVPTIVPPPTKEHFATPCGLLFNELKHSPEMIVEALKGMLATVIELDEGRYTPRSAGYILYVVRLVIRVEAYILAMLEHDTAVKAGDLAGSGARSYVRGIDCPTGHIESLRAARESLRGKLDSEVFPLLEGWCKRCSEKKEIENCCVLWAHLAYMYMPIYTEQLDKHAVTILLIAQIFLHSNYRFSSDSIVATDSLGVQETELFDTFQRHRAKVMSFLEENADDCNEVMECVIRVMTMTGWLKSPEVASESDELSTTSSATLVPTTTFAQHAARSWASLQEPGYSGRFQPDTEQAASLASRQTQFDKYDEYLQYMSTQLVETEINVQLGEYTLKKQSMEIVSASLKSAHPHRAPAHLLMRGSLHVCSYQRRSKRCRTFFLCLATPRSTSSSLSRCRA